MDDDPGFMFAILPFVMMGMLAAAGILLSLILVAALSILRGGRSIRLHALLTGLAAVFMGFTMAPFGGVLTVHGLVLMGSGGLVVVALASPAAEREVGPLLGLKHPREYVRPGVTPWWETWREGLQSGLTRVEWVAVVAMVPAMLLALVLMFLRRAVPGASALLLAMALALYVEHGMRARRASRRSRP